MPNSKRVRRVLCVADPRGSAQTLERALEAVGNGGADAVVLIGDLSGDQDKPAAYRSFFQALGKTELPAFWVPGPGDAPVQDYLREAYNIEIVFPRIHGVHGTAAFGPGYALFAGMGGEISDDPGEPREEQQRLRYPRWEAEYRLKLLRELKEYELVFAFSTPIAHKGLDTPGSEALAELVGTFRPRVAVCPGEQDSKMIGRSLVVSPGSLHDGHYAVADLHDREAALAQMAVTA